MLFNSIEFFLFFPIVTLIYFLIPNRFRWFHLLVASCIFYMAFIPVYILILFFTIIIDYIAGIAIEDAHGYRRKLFLVISIVSNIGVLAVFKYYNFFISNLNLFFHDLPLLNIILPIGLSFHTFQAMAYTIEVYRGNQKAERHFGIYSLYVMFYPQLVAGPIERPQNLLHQFREEKHFDYPNVVLGLRLMLWGFFKKIVIADRLATITTPVFNDPHHQTSFSLLLGVLFFAFQIYCDFSGYSDIALGAARIMGFKLMTNFNRPYQSRSIAEFWKRWHISLSTWFKDYLYISLGGNRVSVPRWYFNLFFVFLVSGFWHGANWTFIIWGALHGFYLVFALVSHNFREKLLKKTGINKTGALYSFLQVTSTFFLVSLAWIFFRARNVSDAFYMINRVRLLFLKALNLDVLKTGLKNFPFSRDIILSMSLIVGLSLAEYIMMKKPFGNNFLPQHRALRWLVYYAVFFAIIYLGVFEKRDFIYFQF